MSATTRLTAYESTLRLTFPKIISSRGCHLTGAPMFFPRQEYESTTGSEFGDRECERYLNTLNRPRPTAVLSIRAATLFFTLACGLHRKRDPDDSRLMFQSRQWLPLTLTALTELAAAAGCSGERRCTARGL